MAMHMWRSLFRTTAAVETEWETWYIMSVYHWITSVFRLTVLMSQKRRLTLEHKVVLTTNACFILQYYTSIDLPHVKLHASALSKQSIKTFHSFAYNWLRFLIFLTFSNIDWSRLYIKSNMAVKFLNSWTWSLCASRLLNHPWMGRMANVCKYLPTRTNLHSQNHW